MPATNIDLRPGTNTNPGEGRACQPYLRFRAQTGPPGWATGAVVTAPFGVGWGLACAVVDAELGRVQAFASSHEPGIIGTWGATELTPAATWQFSEALVLPPGFKAFNTAVGKGVLPDGTTGYAMLIEVSGPYPGGFNIIVATSHTLEGPYSLGPAAPETGLVPLPDRRIVCHAPTDGFCERPFATPTHTAAGVLRSGVWPKPTYDAAAAALGVMCNAEAGCAAFGLGTDAKVPWP